MGLSSFIREIENYLNLTSLGVTKGMASIVAKEIQPNISEAERLETLKKLRSGAQLQTLVSILAFLISVVLTIFIDKIAQGLSPENILMARAFTLIYGFSLSLIISSGVYLSILEGSQLIAQSNIYNLVNALIAAAVGVILVHFGFSLYGLALASLFASIFLFIQLRLRTAKLGFKLDLLSFSVDWSALKSIFSLSGWILFAELGALLSFNSGRMILGVTAGMGMVAVNKFALLNALPQALKLQSNRIARILRPGLTQLYHNGAGEARAVQIAALLLKLSGFIAAGIFSWLLIANGPFVKLWVGEEYYAGPIPNLLIALFASLCVWTFTFKMLMEVRFEFQRRGWIIGLAGLMTIILSLALVKNYGLAGIIFAGLAAEVVFVFPAGIWRILRWLSGDKAVIRFALKQIWLSFLIALFWLIIWLEVDYRPEGWLELIITSSIIVGVNGFLGFVWLKKDMKEFAFGRMLADRGKKKQLRRKV